MQWNPSYDVFCREIDLNINCCNCREIVYDVNIREMQSAAAENVLRNLHPLLISNFPAEKKTRLFLDNWDNWPSAIAAKTILYAVKKTK